MNTIWMYIQNTSDVLAASYHLNLTTFLIIYVASFIPFYLGYFLMLYGSTRSFKWHDTFSLKFRGNFQWDSKLKLGLYVHIFGRVMPYIYVLGWGRNLPIWFYAVMVLAVIAVVLFVIKKISSLHRAHQIQGIEVIRMDKIENTADSEKLWAIYDKTFDPINRKSPCKQSFDRQHFMETLLDSTVRKYVLKHPQAGVVGLGLITDNFINTPWISEDYFKANYPEEHSKKLIYYFMGMAIDKAYRGNRYSIALIEHIIDDIPKEAVMGFDHSHNVNPMLHHFTRIVRQAHFIERKHIDRQHYHVVSRKK